MYGLHVYELSHDFIFMTFSHGNDVLSSHFGDVENRKDGSDRSDSPDWDY